MLCNSYLNSFAAYYWELRFSAFDLNYFFLSCLLSFFFFMYLPSPNLELTPPGTYNPNARGSDACRGAIVYGPEL